MLHTWGQTLIDHYHLHCVVAAGGISLEDGEWVARKRGWLFSVKALSEVFRARYLKGLRELFDRGGLGFHGKTAGLARPENFDKFLARAAGRKWVVYSKRPFAGPETVLKYLSRYTHRLGITHHRLKAHAPEKRTVTFEYRDYADNSRSKTMTLRYEEFVRRLALHILPPRFVRIRHYGFLANRGRVERIAHLKDQLGEPELPASAPDEPRGGGRNTALCPHCGLPTLKLVAIYHGPVPLGRAPPTQP